MDAILIANKLVDDLVQKKKERFLCELDMGKHTTM